MEEGNNLSKPKMNLSWLSTVLFAVPQLQKGKAYQVIKSVLSTIAQLELYKSEYRIDYKTLVIRIHVAI